MSWLWFATKTISVAKKKKKETSFILRVFGSLIKPQQIKPLRCGYHFIMKTWQIRQGCSSSLRKSTNVNTAFMQCWPAVSAQHAWWLVEDKRVEMNCLLFCLLMSTWSVWSYPLNAAISNHEYLLQGLPHVSGSQLFKTTRNWIHFHEICGDSFSQFRVCTAEGFGLRRDVLLLFLSLSSILRT